LALNLLWILFFNWFLFCLKVNLLAFKCIFNIHKFILNEGLQLGQFLFGIHVTEHNLFMRIETSHQIRQVPLQRRVLLQVLFDSTPNLCCWHQYIFIINCIYLSAKFNPSKPIL
jgi:hypothetical protein